MTCPDPGDQCGVLTSGRHVTVQRLRGPEWDLTHATMSVAYRTLALPTYYSYSPLHLHWNREQ